MKYKYYLVFRYNKDKKYCGHDVYKIKYNDNINKYISEYDIVIEISKDKYNNEQSYYKIEINY